jgi:Xaa-Pro aminopeptidase
VTDHSNVLVVADSERDADMLYAAGWFAPDPFIYFRIDGKSCAVVNDLELDRVKKKSPRLRVLSHSQCVEKLRRNRVKRPGMAAVISLLLREHRLRKIFVPASFPLGLAKDLRNYKIKVRVKKGGVFPEREFKCAEEIKKISAALIMAEVGLAEGIQALRAWKIARDGKLMYHGVPLTSEKLRSIINVAIMQAGGLPGHTIVAGGSQACDPHEQGHGLLRAHQPIILDVFPRSQKTGYFGDITRTIVRGRAAEPVRRLFDTVSKGQEIALSKIRPSTAAAKIHAAVQQFFEQQGYKTCRKNGHMHGFFHGTGHGLGLEIHEAPRLAQTSTDTLKPGHVVTVEPGLYYPGLGGVRLEDVACVTGHSHRNLTKFEKIFEI